MFSVAEGTGAIRADEAMRVGWRRPRDRDELANHRTETACSATRKPWKYWASGRLGAEATVLRTAQRRDGNHCVHAGIKISCLMIE
jgi:hypothetical protein